jgi:LysM repeat protein
MGTRILLIFLCLPLGAAAQLDVQRQYIELYKTIAIQEMERTGVPASIKLAQAILESNAGQSELAVRANNHFGIKCGYDWTGGTFEKVDDEYDASGRPVKSCFRRYRRPEESFVAHSEFLRDPKKEWRYGFLFRLDPLDYKGWATGLRIAGYATNAAYDQRLITIIERFQLNQYDRPYIMDPFENVVENTYEDVLIGVFQVNDIDMVFARENETPTMIAERTGRDVYRIIRYNEMLTRPNEPLQEGDRVFLEKKRCGFRGDRKHHFVKADETMYDISQIYGIQLNKLYKKNRMPDKSQPAEGESIRLRGRISKNTPRPRLVSEAGAKSEYPAVINIVDFAWPPDEELAPLPDPAPPVRETPPPAPTLPPTPKPVEAQPDPAPIIPPVVVPPTPDPSPTLQPVYHTVQPGDTLYSLSRRYGTTVENIQSLNGLSGTLIRVGQQLRIN